MDYGFIEPDINVDVVGETCPVPLVEMRKALLKIEKGQIIKITGDHPPSQKEIPMAVQSFGSEIIRIDEHEGMWTIYIRK